eukprot:7763583-Pyramimonas_sp.AAC.1
MKRSESSCAAESWTCSCSEALSMHSALAHYFRTQVHDCAVRDVILSMADVIGQLWYCLKLPVPAATINANTVAFIKHFKA